MSTDNSLDLYRTEPGSVAGAHSCARFGNLCIGPKICLPAKRFRCGL